LNGSYSFLALLASSALTLVACAKPEPTASATTRVAPAPQAQPAQSAQQAATRPPEQPAQAAQQQQQAANEQPAAPQPAQPQDPALAGIPSAFDNNGARRTCAQLPARAGYDCVETPNGPTQVISRSAAANVDPCATATCMPNTRCVADSVTIGGSEHRLPRCVATGDVQNAPPSRNPCASHLCPLGYHCTAPADRPACVPDSAGW
jgi:hypothetical protein